jgi:hypothetical protein
MRGKPKQLYYKNGDPVPDAPSPSTSVFPLYDQVDWPKGSFREIIKPPALFDPDERRAYEAGYYPIEVEYLDEAYHPLLKYAVARSLAKWAP